MSRTARAFWVGSPGEGEIRESVLPPPGPGEAVVRSLYSGVSRGTEALVFRGAVPPSQRQVMRAPFQEGDFGSAFKYGYLNVGVVEEGSPDLVGTTVFSLFPHQTRFVLPVGALRPVPGDVPPGRAVLAGAVETAVNALWDAPPLLGDRLTVVGAGMVGCTVARLASRVPGVRVQLVDVDPGRAGLAKRLGVEFALPGDAGGGRDRVFHTSADPAGLERSLELVRDEGEVVEMSWYGDRRVCVPLGEGFHSRRLTVRSSQVGTVSPARRGSRGHGDRIDLALELLSDPAFDALVTGESPFEELPAVMPRLADGSLPALCHRIVYPEP
ncbi:dehydrogenase [Nocardiopsis tropica]|uniref:Dehydrogenase n=1 Tax=Nocardiopsis tropica TaxID=109330 RepID=A0ABU7L1G5_9ACTN|nr:dehydrogenase [Nocardiopsis umidischolae]MEE2055391.1 dehydrogenase [Nocardiopsis umidischolae]